MQSDFDWLMRGAGEGGAGSRPRQSRQARRNHRLLLVFTREERTVARTGGKSYTAIFQTMNGTKQENSIERRRRLLLIVAAILVAVVILAAFISRGGKEVPVRAARAIRGPIFTAISTNGKIVPVDNFEAHAPAPATVKRILVAEGDHVRAGQLLLQLDDAQARAQAARAQSQLRAAAAELSAVKSGGTREEVLTTKAQLIKARDARDAAQRNLQALQRLQQKGAASAGEVQAAENRLRAAEADLNLLQQKETSRYSPPEVEKVQSQTEEARAALAAAQDLLQHANVRAPGDGVVYSLPVRAGQFVNSGDLLVQVAKLTTVRVQAFVDEPDIGRLRPEEQVNVTWDALPGRVWQGTVTRVPASVIMLGARSVGEITCTINNSDLKLLPNVNVSVSVITAKNDQALTVPREAVHQDDGKRFVYQIVDGQLKRHEVQTAIANLTRIEITAGLNENAEVALSPLGSRPLHEGLSVRVVSQ
jgi:HlyD family secretion protein